MVFKVINSYGRSEYAMNEDKVIQFKSPGTPGAVPDVLTEVLREGARQLLTSAIEAEVAAFLERFQSEKTSEDVKRMVRNGRLPSRTIQTGIEDIEVSVPRVRDREGKLRYRIDSAAVSAAHEDAGGAVAVAVPERPLHGRFSGSADSIAGQGRTGGVIGQHDQPAEGELEGRAAALVTA
jgi:hypothetical protein